MSKTESRLLGNEQAISKLLKDAREQGVADSYSGKRCGVRYRAAMQLDSTTDTDDRTADWPVTMHNVSGGGCAFWSRQELVTGTPILIRPFGSDDEGGWIPACVQHCANGLRGYLVGAAFDDPLPPDDVSNAEPAEGGAEATESPDPLEPPDPATSRRWWQRWSIPKPDRSA